ncbi:TAXI family TRAP transporter solute-binding subunit, partial [Pseudophaeobacter sp.]|uniref:TAXI family TRAP transporter solute-binding subunit n=1 Tax=Pseudophaeobacter sp. TaxID=1971739 RepID=UPI0032988774
MGLFRNLTGAALACTMFTGMATAQDMTFFRIGTGGAGGTYFPIGGIIANAISNPPGSRACDEGGNCGVPGLVAMAQSTNASAHNVNAIQAGQMEAGLSGAAT